MSEIPACLQALRDRARARRAELRNLWHRLPTKGRQKAAAKRLRVNVATIRRDMAVIKREGFIS